MCAKGFLVNFQQFPPAKKLP